MRLLSLDLARKCGWASGDSAEKPTSWSSALGEPGDAIGLQCGELARQLVAYRRKHGVPDLVCIEHHMAPKSQPSDKIIVSSLMLRGTVHAIMGGVYGCKIAEPYPATIRSAVCGRANAGDRDATKRMVVATMHALALLPKDVRDDNRADALAGWHYCASTFGGKWPSDFTLV